MKYIASRVSAALCWVCVLGLMLCIPIFIATEPSQRLIVLGYFGVLFGLTLFTAYLYGVSNAVEEARDNLGEIKQLLQNVAGEKGQDVADIADPTPTDRN